MSRSDIHTFIFSVSLRFSCRDPLIKGGNIKFSMKFNKYAFDPQLLVDEVNGFHCTLVY